MTRQRKDDPQVHVRRDEDGRDHITYRVDIPLSEHEKVVLKQDAQMRHLVAELLEEPNDRAAVLVGSSMLEGALEHLIKAHLEPPPDKKDELFGPGGPLTFSWKIDLAQRMGLIDLAFRRVLHGFRKKIRNRFAHDVLMWDLSQSPFPDSVMHLYGLVQHMIDDDFQLQNRTVDWSTLDDPKLALRVTLFVLAGQFFARNTWAQFQGVESAHTQRVNDATICLDPKAVRGWSHKISLSWTKRDDGRPFPKIGSRPVIFKQQT